MDEQIKKFMAVTGYSPSVVTVECERQTASCVWIKGRRSAKRSDYESYFDTFGEAKQHLIDWNENKVEAATSRLEHAQERLQKAKSLTAPEAPHERHQQPRAAQKARP